MRGGRVEMRAGVRVDEAAQVRVPVGVRVEASGPWARALPPVRAAEAGDDAVHETSYASAPLPGGVARPAIVTPTSRAEPLPGGVTHVSWLTLTHVAPVHAAPPTVTATARPPHCASRPSGPRRVGAEGGALDPEQLVAVELPPAGGGGGGAGEGARGGRRVREGGVPVGRLLPGERDAHVLAAAETGGRNAGERGRREPRG